jgi:hypothetical protein
MAHLIWTDEQRKAQSKRVSGKGNPMYGKKVIYTPEQCKARSLRQQGENNTFFGKHHTEETKRKISEKAKQRTGEKSPVWKGGTYIKNHNTMERRFVFREDILKRDDYTCLLCRYRNKKGMHVHHIDLDNSNNDLLNGVTLCKYCHESMGIHNKKYADKWRIILTKIVKDRYENTHN